MTISALAFDIVAAAEEVLRYEGPVRYDCRAATRDVRLHGTTIPRAAR